MRKIILASTSPRRKELLAKTGLEFEAVSSDYEEDMSLPMQPGELVKFLSRGKAEAVASKYEDAIIISGDTIVFFDGYVLGKPHTKERAKEMLLLLSGKENFIFSGFTIIDTKNKKSISDFAEGKIKFRNLSEKEIDDYIEVYKPLGFAGAYAIQDVRDLFVEKMEGDYEAIVGFPIGPIMKTLESFDIK